MLRFLPYLIVCLLIVLGSKMFTIFDKNHEASDQNESNIAYAANDTSANTDSTNDDNLNQIVKAIQQEASSNEANKKVYNNNIKDLPNVNCISHISQTDLSTTEIDILKSLKQRREELEDREQELIFKENTIQLTKAQVDERLRTLQLLRDELTSIIKQYNIKEDEKSAKLVRVYESMKPKDAARIFEEMQLNILLEVVEKMRETRLAPILASMEPLKAKEVTVALVNRRKSMHN